MYADLVKKKAKPAVKKLYPDGDAIWQDDGATINRGKVALDAVKCSLKTRINPDIQAPKMADFWPITMYGPLLKLG